MSPGRGRSQSAPTRIDELIAVSARLFVTRGYDATSMQEIADEMGILKGSVYHYVRTKEDLLWMIVEPRLTELVEIATAIFADADRPVLARISAAIEANAERFEIDYPYMIVITRENGETISAERREQFTALRDRYHQLWKSAITEGIASGELRGDLDASVTVEAIFGMVNWMFRWYHPEGPLSAREIGGAFAAIVTAGIASPSRA
jgi:AcrR family transcriptional regulator